MRRMKQGARLLGRTVPYRQRRAAQAVADASIIWKQNQHRSTPQNLGQEEMATVVIPQLQQVAKRRSATNQAKRKSPGKSRRHCEALAVQMAYYARNARAPRKSGPSAFTTFLIVLAALLGGIFAASQVSDLAAQRLQNIKTAVEQHHFFQRG